MSRHLWIGGALFALALVQVAVAQQAPAVPRPGERTREAVRENREARRDARTDQRGEANAAENRKIESMDQFMVSWLAPCNEEEIILGKMAQQRAQNEEVQKFAAQMIQDHGKFLEDLRKFGRVEDSLTDTKAAREATGEAKPDLTPPASVDKPADEGTVRETVRDVGEATREVVRDVGDAVRNVVGYTDSADACRIKQEIHRECLALTESELDKKQGIEFDKCYLGTQVGAHLGMLATLKTFEKHASDEMRPLIQQARATTEQHFNHAKELMKELDRPSTAARRPAGNTIPE